MPTKREGVHVSVGDIVALSDGEDNEYSVSLFCVVLKDISPEVFTAFKDEMTSDSYLIWNMADVFANYLLEEGYVAPVKYKELHLGSYGEFQPCVRIKES